MYKSAASTPDDRKFAKTHEWVKLEGTIAVVGISDHAQQSLGDITFVDLPKPGRTVAKAESCAVIESVKAASDIYAPVSGTISDSNTGLENHPETINADPYGDAWLFKITVTGPDAIQGLMSASEYDAFVENEK